MKKKGKVIITKPDVFSRRTSKKKTGKEDEEVVFKKPPPNFEERLKAMELGSGMVNFKILKYESRTTEENK